MVMVARTKEVFERDFLGCKKVWNDREKRIREQVGGLRWSNDKTITITMMTVEISSVSSLLRASAARFVFALARCANTTVSLPTIHTRFARGSNYDRIAKNAIAREQSEHATRGLVRSPLKTLTSYEAGSTLHDFIYDTPDTRTI